MRESRTNALTPRRSVDSQRALAQGLAPRPRRLPIATLAAALAATHVHATDLGSVSDVPTARTTELERLVLQDCGSCHGMTLKGGLGGDLRPAALAGAAPEALAAIILDGIPGTPMPPWRPLLTEGEALWIAQYLLTAGK